MVALADQQKHVTDDQVLAIAADVSGGAATDAADVRSQDSGYRYRA
jgi:hypothetical protein